MTSKVVCAEYATNEKVKILDRKIYDEGVLKNIKKAINFVEKRIKTEFVIKSAKRIEIPQFPKEAYREAIVNAIMHRDYFDKTSDTMVECYRNKLVVYNPGGLVKWLKPEEFGKISKTRNSIIASLLSRTIYAEKRGTGIKRIKESMKNNGLKPKFEYYEHSFYIELQDKNFSVEDRSEANSKDRKSRKKWILSYLNKNRSIKAKDIEEKFNIHRDTAVEDLKSLKNKIIKKGSGSNVWYELNQK